MKLHEYSNGSWVVEIYQDGTKIRTTDDLTPHVEFPESMDVKINGWCDAGCAWCHENSTTKGMKSPDLPKIIDLYSQLPAGVEIAIGGGNPLAHAGFDEFVEELSNQGKICNVTVNEFHFEDERKRLERLISNGHLRGVGYSYTKTPLVWDYEHAVNHVIVGVTPYGELHNIVSKNSGKVLLLGYKNFRRGSRYIETREKQVQACIMTWYRKLFNAVHEAKLSFDNLAIEQLNPKRVLANWSDYDTYYMGTDGSHTMYIDAEKGEFAVSSTSPIRHSLDNLTIREIFEKVKV
jgi:hypothetical protein